MAVAVLTSRHRGRWAVIGFVAVSLTLAGIAAEVQAASKAPRSSSARTAAGTKQTHLGSRPAAAGSRRSVGSQLRTGASSRTKAKATKNGSRPRVAKGATQKAGVRATGKATRARKVAQPARHRRAAQRPRVTRVASPSHPLPLLEETHPVLSVAADYLGRPYRFGGAHGVSFDCSGLTRTVYAHLGVDLPHSASAQFRLGRPVPRDDLQPGDLVFFRTYRRGASHVGIYAGEGMFIHAASRGGSVRVDPLEESYYASRYLGARRLLDAAPEEVLPTLNAALPVRAASYDGPSSHAATLLPAAVPARSLLGGIGL